MYDMVVTENPNRKKGEISFEERLKELEKEQLRSDKREKQSPFDEFAQFNMQGHVHTGVMLSLADSPSATKIFWFITKHMDCYNALIASYKVFEEGLNMSIPTIARGIKVLKDKGVLHIKKSGSANVYLINPDLVWKSWGNNKKYCEFPAKVMLAQSEQYPDAQRIFSNQMHKTLTPKNEK